MRVCVLISGRGSNMEALLEAAQAEDYPATIVRVISNNADAPGLKKAEAAGVGTAVLDHRGFEDRPSFETALDELIRKDQPDLICLAGFMRILTADFVNAWRDRIINIHPSLLPAYRGLHTHERVLEDGVRFTGCTVHFVRPEMDDGPIILQACVPVGAQDTPDSLAAKVLAWEHRVYPLAVRLMAEGKLRIRGRTVEIDAPLEEQEGLIAPGLPKSS